MRGRELFKIFNFLIYLISGAFRLLPRVLAEKVWILLDIFPGLIGVGLRYALARRLAQRIGSSVFFGRGVEIIGWRELVIGNNVSIHKDCYLDASGGITIGDDVSIAHASSVLSFEHTWADLDLPIRSNPCLFKSVYINNDVWIGCGCRILAGVTVGNRSVIAAGAVVNKDIESMTIAGGVPARILKRI